MAEKKKSPVLPAQARLLKLKQNLKASQKAPSTSNNSGESSSQKTFPLLSGKQSKAVDDSILKAAAQMKKMRQSKTSVSGMKVRTDRPKLLSPSEKGLKKENMSLLNIRKKEGGAIQENKIKNSFPRKRLSSCSPDSSLNKSKKMSENKTKSQVQGSPVRMKGNTKTENKTATSTKKSAVTSDKKIKKLSFTASVMQKARQVRQAVMSMLPGSNNTENVNNNAQYKSTEGKAMSSPKKSSSFSTSDKINTSQSIKRSNSLGSPPIQKSSSNKEKELPITDTGKKNLFKRKKLPINITGKTLKLLESDKFNLTAYESCDSAISSARGTNIKEFKRINDQSKKDIGKGKPVPNYQQSLSKQHFSAEASMIAAKNFAGTSVRKKNETLMFNNEVNNMSGGDISDQTMEWEPSKEDLLRCTRNEIDPNEEMMDWQDGISETTMNEKGEKCVYIVVDTNVLIQDLSLIRKLILMELRGFSVIIMIPWQVLKELDKLKNVNDRSVAMCARKASKFLSESQSEGRNIIFQKQSHHFEDVPQVLVEVPDDHLIKCCCQLMNDNKKVVLLSNDTNLRVKTGAILGIMSVHATWIYDLIGRDSKPSRRLHSFEKEPEKGLNNNEIICANYLHKLTRCLVDFLSRVISEIYKNKYQELWIFWLPRTEMSLVDSLNCAESVTVLEPFKNHIEDIWKFYKEKFCYADVNAVDIERHGRTCILFAKTIHHLVPDISSQFDKDLGFLKTGNLEESFYGFTSASFMVAQTFFKRMEDKLHSSLSFLEQLVSKIHSERVTVPDVKVIIKNIDLNIIITNEASTAFLLLDKDEDLPLNSPEIVIFYKSLLSFLEIELDKYSFPFFSPEDIVLYINQERSNLNPAALQWLSDLRRQFTEYKSLLKNY